MVLIKTRWSDWDYWYHQAHLKLRLWRSHLYHPDPRLGFLSHFMPLISFDTPWNHQKTRGNDIQLREVESLKMHLWNTNTLIFILSNINISTFSTMYCKVKWLDFFVSGSKSISRHTEGGPPDSESQNVVRSPPNCKITLLYYKSIISRLRFTRHNCTCFIIVTNLSWSNNFF